MTFTPAPRGRSPHDDAGDRPLAVVTGPTAGIGRAFAERLAAAGHDLLLVSRDAARLGATAADLAARHGVRVDTHPADLADEDAVRTLAARLSAAPRVDLLVNNAGFGTHARIVGGDPELEARMIAVHCAAPLRLAQAVLPGMVARHAGAVVNVASVAAFTPNARYATYNATKAFLQLLSEGIAAEVAASGVRVQALCPGLTRTEFHARMGARGAAAVARIPGALWMSADAVVDASLRALARGGPVTVVPGLGYRATVAVLRRLPLRALAWGARASA
ncbi:dehydrogenase [Gemmatimonadetes bacterium T265]|nr:dehydrogenase [Gemmatimonadetes bacterium T265]